MDGRTSTYSVQRSEMKEQIKRAHVKVRKMQKVGVW